MAEEFIKTKVFPFGYIKGQSAGQKLVKDDARRKDSGPGVKVVRGWISWRGAHVAGSADEPADAGIHGLASEEGSDGFGEAEIDDARLGLVVDFDDEDVG